MKKIIAIVVAAVLVIGGAVGAYFLLKPEAPEEGTVSISASKGDMIETISLIERYMIRPEMYKDSMGSLYSMTDEEVDKFFEAPEDWLAYEYMVNIKNTGEEAVSVYGFEIEGNGKNKVYLSNQFGGELGLAEGAEYTVSISVLCSDGDMTTDEVKAAADKAKIKILYSKQPTELDDGTDSVEEIKKLDLVTE